MAAAQPAEPQFGLSEAEKRHYEERGYVRDPALARVAQLSLGV